ncbi:hypothetical protein D3C81_1829790 [compost metagenome]
MIGQGLLQGLEHQHPGALTAHIAVGLGREGFAAAHGAEHPRLAHGLGNARLQQDIHPAHQRPAAVAIANGLDAFMDRHQGTGTGRIDGHARPGQVQQVRHAVGQHAVAVAEVGQRVDIAAEHELTGVIH